MRGLQQATYYNYLHTLHIKNEKNVFRHAWLSQVPITVWQLWLPSDAALSPGKQRVHQSGRHQQASQDREQEQPSATHLQTMFAPEKQWVKVYLMYWWGLPELKHYFWLIIPLGRLYFLSGEASWHQSQTVDVCKHLESFREAADVRFPVQIRSSHLAPFSTFKYAISSFKVGYYVNKKELTVDLGLIFCGL